MNRYRVDPNITAARRYLAKCQWDHDAYHVYYDTIGGAMTCAALLDWTMCEDDACAHPAVNLPTEPRTVYKFHMRNDRRGTIYSVGRAGALAIMAVSRS